MVSLTLICQPLLLFFAVKYLNAQYCVPTNLRYLSAGTTVYLSWYYEEGNNCTGAIVVSKLGASLTYHYSFNAAISFPNYCTTYEIGVMPFTERGVTGNVEYLNVTTEAPYFVNMDYLSIYKNHTYISAEWAAKEILRKCVQHYLVVVSITNYSSPLDTEKSFKKMTLIHRQTSTTYDIMPIEDCVNNTISITVSAHFNGFNSEVVVDRYICY